jgi:peptidoglycan-associated lipoprotein
VLVACASSSQDKPGLNLAKSQAPAAQSRLAPTTPRGVGSENLQRQQDRSALDALKRGDKTGTASDSALKEVFFDFDQYSLDSQDRATLRASADWLKKNPSVRVEIEGHCDERGTNDYNLALGAKRAQAAKDYLVSLGIAEPRLSITSYGEEIPVCRDQTENCWQRNRRDRFVRVVPRGGTF